MREDGGFIFLASVMALLAVCVLAGSFFGLIAVVAYKVFQALA